MKRILYIIAFVFTLSITAWAQETETTANRVVIAGEYFYVHTVQPGETFYSLSRKYNVSQTDIVKYNPQMAEGLRAGESIKIPAPAPDPLPRNIRNRTTSNRKVEVHTVNQGETAYSIVKRYEVSIDKLIESNPGLDPTTLSIGQRILIPRGVIGTATPGEIDAEFTQYTEALTEVTEGWGYHLVERGQTLYSLTRELNIPEDTLRKYNPAELTGGLKAGTMLRYPVAIERPSWPAEESGTESQGIDDQPETYGDTSVKSFNTSAPLQVALIMPFTSNGQTEASAVDYYNGTLLALEDLKTDGISVNLMVYDTKRSVQETRRILRQNEMENADLIIGPRTAETFEVASRFASRNGIPIVSPITQLESESPFVYQIRPSDEFQYDKLKPFLSPDFNIVLLTPASGLDAAFQTEIEKMLPANAKRVSYTGRGSATAIRNALSRDTENILIIPTDSEAVTDEILPTISSIQNNISSTTGRGYPIRVIGSPQWARFQNNDREQFFKLQAMYVTLYYADRTTASVNAFGQRYLSSFGSLPSMFSYRGYDMAKLFISAIKQYGDRYARSINRINTPLLQVPYHFRQDSDGKWVNDQWVLVQYRSDYIIDVK